MYNILWVPLIEGHQTGGSFSVIEQWMRKDSGALVPHVHNFCDEWFYMIDGTIEFTVSGEKLPAKAGENVWVARGTVHSFVVTSDVCHVLNGYTPGGFEQVIKHLAKPAERRELPPDTLPPPDERDDAADLQQLLDLRSGRRLGADERRSARLKGSHSRMKHHSPARRNKK